MKKYNKLNIPVKLNDRGLFKYSQNLIAYSQVQPISVFTDIPCGDRTRVCLILEDSLTRSLVVDTIAARIPPVIVGQR